MPHTSSRPPRRRRLLLTTAVLGLVAASLLATCSGSDDGDAARTTTTRSERSTTTTSAVTTSTTAGTPSSTVPGTTTAPPKPLPDNEKGYKEALAAQFDPAASGAQGVTEDDMTCVARKIVDVVGVGAFKDAGISADGLRDGSQKLDDLDVSEADARKLVRAYSDCGLDVLALYRKGLRLDQLDAKQRACVEKAVTKQNVEDQMVAQITQKPDADNPLNKLSDCVK